MVMHGKSWEIQSPHQTGFGAKEHLDGWVSEVRLSHPALAEE